MRGVSLLVFLLASLRGQIAEAGTTITVGQGVGYDYATIQAAIDAATAGDTVMVYPGIYYENIHFRGKSIILRSTDPINTATVETTVIDGRSSSSVVTFAGRETSSCVLTGFTIRNGWAGDGGGIRGYGTKALIARNIIRDNWVNFAGGGLIGCYGVIQNNMIAGNEGSHGAGLADCGGTIENNTITENVRGEALFACHGTIRNNMITDNWGGLQYCNGTIENNTITGNASDYGGGSGLTFCVGTIRNNVIAGNRTLGFGGGLVSCAPLGSDTTATIENNTICNNSAATGGGLWDCKAVIVNCIIWGNTAASSQTAQLFASTTPTYSCIQDWTGGGEGNIAAYPWFADDNYYLLPKSPCVDAGNPAAEYNDACRPPGLGTSRNDMGAYGGPYNCLWPAPPPSARAGHWTLYR